MNDLKLLFSDTESFTETKAKQIKETTNNNPKSLADYWKLFVANVKLFFLLDDLIIPNKK